MLFMWGPEIQELRGLFSFLFVPENHSETFNPLEKAPNSAGMFKGCLCCLEDLIRKSIPGFICSSYLKGIFFFPKNPGLHLAHAAILQSKEKDKISIEGLKFGSLRRGREEEAEHGGTGRQVKQVFTEEIRELSFSYNKTMEECKVWVWCYYLH